MNEVIYLDGPYKTRKAFPSANVLEKAWDVYLAIVENYAIEVFEARLRWMKKNHCRYIAGNGTYYLSKTKKNGEEVELFDEDCPKFIRRWLEMPVPGISWGFLGDFMPCCDYRKGEENVQNTNASNEEGVSPSG